MSLGCLSQQDNRKCSSLLVACGDCGSQSNLWERLLEISVHLGPMKVLGIQGQ